MAIDYETDKLYWTTDENKKIQRANVDGSSVEDILTFSGQERPFGIYIDKKSNKLYWTDYGLDKIFRSDLDGSNQEDVLHQQLKNPLSIVVYNKENNIVNSTDDERLKHSFFIYPNPARQFLHFKFLDSIKFPVKGELHTIDGKLLRTFQITAPTDFISTELLHPGIYFIKIRLQNGSVFQQAFIKS